MKAAVLQGNGRSLLTTRNVRGSFHDFEIALNRGAETTAGVIDEIYGRALKGG